MLFEVTGEPKNKNGLLLSITPCIDGWAFFLPHIEEYIFFAYTDQYPFIGREFRFYRKRMDKNPNRPVLQV